MYKQLTSEQRYTISVLLSKGLKKKVSFNDYDDKDIKDIEEKINSRPRKKLGFETPIERFSKIFL